MTGETEKERGRNLIPVKAFSRNGFYDIQMNFHMEPGAQRAE